MKQIRCSSCGHWKPEEEFYADNHAANGRQPKCKDCETVRGRWNRLYRQRLLPESLQRRCLEEIQEEKCAICRGTLTWHHHVRVAIDEETDESLGFIHNDCASVKEAPDAWAALRADPPMRRANQNTPHVPATYFEEQGVLL